MIASAPSKKFKRATRPESEEGPVIELFGEDDITDLVASAKKFVKGIYVPTGGDQSLLEISDWIPMPTKITELIGSPGLPCGLVTMAMGKEDCGKTTFATTALISAQKNGGIAILVDTENKFSLKRAEQMGLNVKKTIIIPALTIEEAFDKFVTMINHIKSQKKYKDRKIVCVWDSLGATPSDAELDENSKDFSMTAAKIIKGRMRKLLRYIHDTKVAFIIINQVYTNMNMFGKKTTSYGGSGPLYHSALILEFTKVGRIRAPGFKSGEDFHGIRTKIEAVKNHLGQPFKSMEVAIDWKGFVFDRDVERAPDAELRKAAAGKSEEEEPSGEVFKTKKKRASEELKA